VSVGHDAEQRRADTAEADREADRDAAETPRRPGRYSCPITIVTAKVAIVAAPARPAKTTAGTGPESRKPTISGGRVSIEPISTLRRPKRSASGPPIRVPRAPPRSITARAVMPAALLVCRSAT
jgi:hypothetical protein